MLCITAKNMQQTTLADEIFRSLFFCGSTSVIQGSTHVSRANAQISLDICLV